MSDPINEVLKDCKTCRDLKLQHQKEGVDDGCKSSYCCMPLIETVGKLQVEIADLKSIEPVVENIGKQMMAGAIDAHLEHLQAENERLKSAVKQVADKMEFSMQIELVGCVDILRQALAESEER